MHGKLSHLGMESKLGNVRHLTAESADGGREGAVLIKVQLGALISASEGAGCAAVPGILAFLLSLVSS